jgi:heme-degrading monooxygenase HmoA
MASIVLINPFEVPEGQPDEAFLAGWQRAAEYMQAQPGFVNTRLHRALGPDARFRFINVAEWETADAFRAAVTSPEFRQLAGTGPSGHPALYQLVRSI